MSKSRMVEIIVTFIDTKEPSFLVCPIGSKNPSSMERELLSGFHFPPGFRFHPSDEELIVHYLLKKLNSKPLPASVIAEIELYNYNPWELPKKASFGEDEWYFFSPRDRKYPNGDRPNRATTSGYWKATGTDKPIITSSGSRTIGVKKALVFYTGRPPRGTKTDWIMNEYRLPPTPRPCRLKGSMRLDDWVLCKVRRKGNMSKNTWEVPDSTDKVLTRFCLPKIMEFPSAHLYPHMDAISDYGYRGCQVLASLLAASEPFPQMDNISSDISQYQGGSDRGKAPYTDSFLESLSGKFTEVTMCENLIPYPKTMTNNKKEDVGFGNIGTINNMYLCDPNEFQKDDFSPSASFYESSLTEGGLY